MSTALRAGLCGALLLPFGVQAHHSIVVHYDPTNVKAINGTLESVQWANPHSKWVFSVKNDQGVAETWRAEGDAINTLVRNGPHERSLQNRQRHNDHRTRRPVRAERDDRGASRDRGR